MSEVVFVTSGHKVINEESRSTEAEGAGGQGTACKCLNGGAHNVATSVVAPEAEEVTDHIDNANTTTKPPPPTLRCRCGLLVVHSCDGRRTSGEDNLGGGDEERRHESKSTQTAN